MEMQITVEKGDGCTRIIRAEIPAEVISEKLSEGYRDINRQVQIPGFRKGKAPRKVLETRFGKEVTSDIAQSLADDALKQAIEEHALKLLGQPEMPNPPEIKAGSGATITLEAEVFPEFELPRYKGIELERPDPVAAPHEVHARARSEQIEKGELKEQADEYKAEKGDFLRADVLVKSGDETVFEHKAGLLEVGLDWIGGLEVKNAGAQLQGLKAGDEKKLETTVPAKFQEKQLRGKLAEIHLTVLKVIKLDGPPLQEIAKTAGFDTVEEWKESLKAEILSEKEKRLDDEIERRALHQVADSTEMELPKNYSNRRRAEMVQQQAYRLYQANIPEDQIRKFLSEGQEEGLEATKQELKRTFVIDAIARKERLVVTEDELQREVTRLSTMYNMPVDELYARFEDQGMLAGMREEIKKGKVLKLLRQKANYVDEAADGSDGDEEE